MRSTPDGVGRKDNAIHLLLIEIRRNPLLRLLVFVPGVFVAEHLLPDAPTLLFAVFSLGAAF